MYGYKSMVPKEEKKRKFRPITDLYFEERDIFGTYLCLHSYFQNYECVTW